VQSAANSVVVRQGSDRGEQQARGAPGAAVAQHRLEQLGIDLAVPPGARLGERQRDRARFITPARGVLHDDQVAADKPGACLKEAATCKSCSPRRRRRVGTRPVFAVSEARQGERD
jgi:hypothetical protein